MNYTKQLKCGCVIRRKDTAYDYYVDYCPLHKSASDLYEAIQSAIVEIEDGSAHHAHLILTEAMRGLESYPPFTLLRSTPSH